MTTRAGAGAEVRLAPVTEDNRASVLALELSGDQTDMVASNLESLEEAAGDRDARPRAIVAHDRVAGFLMYEAPKDDDDARIYRFMIDRAEQGKGYGKSALRQVLREIGRLRHVRRVSICYMPGNAAARHIYLSAGFVERGLDEDGEMIAELVLPPVKKR